MARLHNGDNGVKLGIFLIQKNIFFVLQNALA
jgi:hypothetical protein